MFKIIVAVDSKNGIAKNGKIPWKCVEDIEHFKNTTIGQIVIMGSKTHKSIGKLLPKRENIIITRSDVASYEEKLGLQQATVVQSDELGLQQATVAQRAELLSTTAKVFNDLWECVRYCEKVKDREIYVIGGAEIYNWFLDNKLVSDCIISKIDGDYDCDQFFKLPDDYVKAFYMIYSTMILTHYTYANNKDEGLRKLIETTLDSKHEQIDRTLVGTRSIFGTHLEFSLRNNKFPLTTLKQTSLRMIFEELIFYLRGQTDNNILVQKGIKIWEPHTSRKYLDERGLQRLPVGDMGHSYGFSFRHKGGQYVDCKTDYTGVGYDQLMHLISDLKTDPFSRRLIIDLWEPEHIHNAALPPCLYNYQFDVVEEDKQMYLSCMMTQRSSDVVTAGGWNIATGALLTIMLSAICDMKPNRLIWNVGNMHIYSNLYEQAKTMIQRGAKIYPKLFVKNIPDDICKFEFNCFELLNYKPHKGIKGIINV